jgi:hypothetical protein
MAKMTAARMVALRLIPRILPEGFGIAKPVR